MTRPEQDVVEGVVTGLQRRGFVLDRVGTSNVYRVRSTSGDLLALEPTLTLPPDLLAEYLDALSRGISYAPNSLAEAIDLTALNLAEEFDTDHHEGRNYTRSATFRRHPDGRVGLVVDKDLPDLPDVSPDLHLRWTAER